MLLGGDFVAIVFKLKRALALAEMTQKELAAVTGIRPPTVSAICTNTIKHVPVDVMDKICKTLNCQPSDFIEYSSDTDA